MKIFDIDISGSDLLSKDYTICIANSDDMIKGFKFNEEIISTICARYGQELYRYSRSNKGKSLLKVRIYCIIIYYLFRDLKITGDLSLNICRDFLGNENTIKESLKYFLGKKLGLKLEGGIYFCRLSQDSNAHKYAFLMRHDNKTKMKTYVNISLEEIEKWLKK